MVRRDDEEDVRRRIAHVSGNQPAAIRFHPLLQCTCQNRQACAKAANVDESTPVVTAAKPDAPAPADDIGGTGKSDQPSASGDQDNKSEDGKSKIMHHPHSHASAPRRTTRRNSPASAALSQSLRKVYESALDERIPDSMMDLLSKLR